MENYDSLTIEKSDHVALVTLNRPERRNALDLGMLTELEHAALSFRDDVDTRAVVFTGAGKHFCAGADLGYLVDLQQKPMIERRRAVRLGERVFHAILGIEQITLCAWNGAAIGDGGSSGSRNDARGRRSTRARNPDERSRTCAVCVSRKTADNIHGGLAILLGVTGPRRLRARIQSLAGSGERAFNAPR